MGVKFEEVFSVRKPIIGMIHLAGENRKDKSARAREELRIYQEEGVDGAIIEDYHGEVQDVYEVLKSTSSWGIVRGVNVLGNPYKGFELARKFGAKFVQFDSVQTRDLNLSLYNALRQASPEICVLGGIGFKYTNPTGNPLEQDLREGMSRCEAIVTTGSGTGIETPLDKLVTYRKLMNGFPLIVGAGVNLRNVAEQLRVADGAIVGSYFKPNGDTNLPVDRKRVRDFMQTVRAIRAVGN